MKKLLLSWASLGLTVCVASPLLASEAAFEDTVQDLSQTTKSPSARNDEDDRQNEDDLGAGLASTDEEIGLDEEDDGYDSPNWDFVDQASPLRTPQELQDPATPDLSASLEGSPLPIQDN